MYRGSQHQRGQALIYGIFVLIGGLTALHFLFNTGQLSSEKTKLVNTADAVAYSAGVMQARALNFDAYNNRALVANEVLVAQMVSLSSWGQYVERHAGNLRSVFPNCSTYYSAFDLQLYDGIFALQCLAVVGTVAGEYAQMAGIYVAKAAELPIFGIEANKAAIKSAQSLLHAPMYFRQSSMSVMQQVADRNYAGDSSVLVSGFTTSSSATVSGAPDILNNFVERYTGDDRVRFAEVAKIAAYSDEFVRERNWTSEAELPPFNEVKCVKQNMRNSVQRRGGTELVNLDEWKAEDTESFWRVTNAGGINLDCNRREHVISYGEQQAHPSDKDQDESSAKLGGSPATNPRASRQASTDAWTNYTGLPSFFDISDRTSVDPVMQFGVRLTRNAASTRTSSGTSVISSTPRLNNFQNNFADGVMTAVAGGEVYFERPLTVPDNQSLGNYNQYAEKISSPDKREIGSLFNPYWQVRLVQNLP